MRGMGRVTDRRRTVRIDGEQVSRRADSVVVEEPLEIRVNGTPLAVTMRTPGDDIDLALGFLCTEGVVADATQVRSARHCAGPRDATGPEAGTGGPEVWTTNDNRYNVLDVALADGVPAPEVDPTRNFYTTSSCGVCGKASIDAVRVRSRHPVAADPVPLTPALLTALPDRLRQAQRVFDRTGGLHAAGLFRSDGSLACVREDVGRHNAVDKVVGWALRENGLPLSGHLLMVSGRASFELVQKASMAGIPVLAAVSAPSTLAVDLAEEVGMTLVGFLRGERMNVYCRDDRIGVPA